MKHDFKTLPTGGFEHYVNNELRATVPAKHKDEYLEAIGQKPEPAPEKK